MYLFFDTETTGLPSSTFTPRIVQLAALLTDEEGNILQQINTLIKPDGWIIPAEATAIHGKTMDMCEVEGRSMPEVLDDFNAFKAASSMRIAHNLRFDKSMLAIEAGIYNIPHDSSNLESFCTMLASVNYCKIPGKRGYKWPKLQEAYKHFFGKNFDNAHDAMADVIACKDVFFKLREIEG